MIRTDMYLDYDTGWRFLHDCTEMYDTSKDSMIQLVSTVCKYPGVYYLQKKVQYVQ